VFFVGAFQFGIDHAQIAVGDLDAADARGHIANGDAEAGGNEVAGKHEHGPKRQGPAQDTKEPRKALPPREGSRSFFDRAYAVAPACWNEIGLNCHFSRPKPSERSIFLTSLSHRLGARL